jgi:hypothetical protein
LWAPGPVYGGSSPANAALNASPAPVSSTTFAPAPPGRGHVFCRITVPPEETRTDPSPPRVTSTFYQKGKSFRISGGEAENQVRRVDYRFPVVVAVLGAAGDEGPSRLHDLGFRVHGLGSRVWNHLGAAGDEGLSRLQNLLVRRCLHACFAVVGFRV